MTTATIAAPTTESTASTHAPVPAYAPTPEDAQRAAEMDTAWKAYKGQLPKPLKVKSNQRDPNAMSNRCEPIVTKGVAFLWGTDVSWTLDQDDKTSGTSGQRRPAKGNVGSDPANQGAQDALDTFWRLNSQTAKLHKLGINGGVFGHAFLKLRPSAKPGQPPRLIVLNPQQVRLVTAPDDCDTVTAFLVSWRVPSPDGKTVIERRQVIERIDPDGGADTGANGLDTDTTWRITDQERAGSGTGGGIANTQQQAWQTTGQETWDYPFPPIFHCQNLPNPNETWGTPDLTADIIQANRDINFTQSNISKILDWHASPLTIAKGMAGQNLVKDPDTILGIGPDASVENVEMHGDLSSSLNFLSVLRANMDEQSRVPAVALGRQSELPRGNLSGIALELLFMPLLEKTTQKRALYGEMLEEVCGAVLVLMGYQAHIGDMPVTTQWPQVLPHDPTADWQVVPMKEQAGVSKTTILEENGYDPAEEAERRAAEAQAEMDAIAKGASAPAAPDLSGEPQPGTAPTTALDQQTGQPQAQPPNGNGLNPNHPAAVAARAKAGAAMKAAFGKA